jgi:hypothetical protein
MNIMPGDRAHARNRLRRWRGGGHHDADATESVVLGVRGVVGMIFGAAIGSRFRATSIPAAIQMWSVALASASPPRGLVLAHPPRAPHG